MKIGNITRKEVEANLGNWSGPSDLFPTIVVDQATGDVVVTTHFAADHKYGWGKTHKFSIAVAEDRSAMFVRGMCGLRNERNRMCGGRQSFCFAVFEGDSGHIYIHRAPATSGWMYARPEEITKRLRKLGIGADAGVVQQGDFLLKKANGASFSDDTFRHEYMGSGHHKFDRPVLRAYDDGVTQVWVTEEGTTIHHHAVDGIQHPDVVVPVGKYIIGTTARSLEHAGMRD